MKKIAIIFRRFGPYHVARLEGAGRLAGEAGVDVVGIEIARTDKTYAWAPAEGAGSFRRRRLFGDACYDDLARGVIRHAVESVLDEEQPDVVALPGWVGEAALAGLAWCRRNAARAVLMSESSRHDFPRHWWREWWKRHLVRQYDAALVGGRSHAAYARELGMPAERIFLGYDVVDNDHFIRGAAQARAQQAGLRVAQSLPEAYFLASGRFVPKKNFAGLLEAFAAYRRRVGDAAWDLVICGDGPLRGRLLDAASAPGVRSHVHFPGFVQYDSLPVLYGLAKAFVHPSTTEQWGLVVNEAMAAGLPVLVSECCGCCNELVEPGVNGYAFDPRDAQGLAALMARLSDGETDLAAMGDGSRRVIAQWSPQRFGQGVLDAARVSLGGR